MSRHLIISAFLLLAINASAQEFRAGPVLGMSFSQVDGDNYAGFNKPGIMFGAFVSRSINDKWDLQLDITYIQKGSREAPKPDKGQYDDYKLHLSYIQFPLVAGYRSKKITVEGGLSINALLYHAEEIDGTPLADMPSHDLVPFKTMEYATVFGLNYHVSERLRINARWMYSINRIRLPYNGDISVYNPRPHWLSRTLGQYNNNFIVSACYTINKIL